MSKPKQISTISYPVDIKQSRYFRCTGHVSRAQLQVDGKTVSDIQLDDSYKIDYDLMFFDDEPFHCCLCGNKTITVVLTYNVEDDKYPSLIMGECLTAVTWQIYDSDPSIVSNVDYREVIAGLR